MAIPTLAEGQFALDGYVFGARSDTVFLLESGLDMGSAEIRNQDQPHPSADAVLFGRDLTTPPAWTFSLGVIVGPGGDLYAAIDGFAAAWSGWAKRSTPGAVSELVYRRNGVTRVVYGRPRAWNIETPKVLQHRVRVLTAQFQLADSRAYSSTLSEVVLGTVHTSTSSGVVFPVVFPTFFGSSPQERAGWVTVTSPVPTPFTVTVTGPSTGVASGFRVESAGWVLDMPVTITPGQTLTVNTASGIVAVNGSPISTGVGRASNLGALLQPGTQEVQFTANDPSATVTATVRWREASTAW